MQLFVRTLAGESAVLEVEGTSSIHEVKARLGMGDELLCFGGQCGTPVLSRQMVGFAACIWT
ncbi:unnamed protein product [Effrenium voratum]|nr:unnamed protein product [Effrenium voratum]